MGHRIKHGSKRYWIRRYPRISKNNFKNYRKRILSPFNTDIYKYCVTKDNTYLSISITNIWTSHMLIRYKKRNFIETMKICMRENNNFDTIFKVSWHHGIRNAKTYSKFHSSIGYTLEYSLIPFASQPQINNFKNYYNNMIAMKSYHKLLKVMNIMFPDGYDLEKKCIEKIIKNGT